MPAVTAVVIGAGSRGSGYANYGTDCPDKLKIVGVAEPRKYHRELLAKKHSIQAENVFEDWRTLAQRPKFADCAFICTQDQMHKEPAILLANLGYHILLEKPMAIKFADCQEIVATCKKNNLILAVGHVLRYSPQAVKIRELLDAKAIGDVINIQLLEPVGFWHHVHAYVRGNWRNQASSSFCLLTKSCHDIDLLMYFMPGKKCARVSSFGSLAHFKKENKPIGASDRCVTCAVEADCPYSAVKLYLGCLKQGITGFPVKILTDEPDIESVTEALRTGPYGICAYECDNDVVDNQVVNLQFSTGETASFTMVAFTEKLCERQVRIFGTKGELTCDFSTNVIRQFEFATQRVTEHNVGEEIGECQGSLKSHGGADFLTIKAFIEAVQHKDLSYILTGADESLESHRITFLAEKSRVQNKVVEVDQEKEIDF